MHQSLQNRQMFVDGLTKEMKQLMGIAAVVATSEPADLTALIA